MSLYFSEETNRLDVKGRVCLPSLMRQQLPKDKKDELFAYTDIKETRLLLFDGAFMQELMRRMEAYSEESYANIKPDTPTEALKWEEVRTQVRRQRQEIFEAISNGFLTRITQLKIDELGRILIPQRLMRHACLEKSVTFCGMGRAIAVYDSLRFEERIAKAKEEQLQARDHAARLMGGLP